MTGEAPDWFVRVITAGLVFVASVLFGTTLGYLTLAVESASR